MSFSNTNQQLPPLRSMQVFEVAARYQSFTAAADELFITQSAVSRQVQELEQSLNIKLFIRSGPHLKVTATGKALAERIGQSMNMLHEAVQMVRPASRSHYINLSMMPSLATKWFAPRLGQFIESNPDIDLRIAATQALVADFEAEEIDAAIRYGTGDWTNLNAELLAEEFMTPVCSPTYAERLELKEPADLLNATLMPTATKENWDTWFDAAGVEQRHKPRGTYIGDAAAILQAVIDGQGVALGRSVLMADDLQAGRIIIPFPVQLKSSYCYWFVTPTHIAANPKLIATREWFKLAFNEMHQ